MAKPKRDPFADCTQALSHDFAHWDYLMEHGGSDPFHADGVNLNLVRNHILYHKHELEQLMEKEDQEPTLFGHTYPEIYYRPVPPEVPYDYMARADEIRAKAQEQLALYEQDPNFCYIRDHHYDLFPNGETKETRAAGFYPSVSGRLLWYRKYVEEDRLVDMRRAFSVPYEQKAAEWAELAGKMQAYFASDHSKISAPVISYEEDDCYSSDPENEAIAQAQPEPAAPSPESKPSLSSQIESAKARTTTADKGTDSREEQLSIF